MPILQLKTTFSSDFLTLLCSNDTIGIFPMPSRSKRLIGVPFCTWFGAGKLDNSSSCLQFGDPLCRKLWAGRLDTSSSFCLQIDWPSTLVSILLYNCYKGYFLSFLSIFWIFSKLEVHRYYVMSQGTQILMRHALRINSTLFNFLLVGNLPNPKKSCEVVLVRNIQQLLMSCCHK